MVECRGLCFGKNFLVFADWGKPTSKAFEDQSALRAVSILQHSRRSSLDQTRQAGHLLAAAGGVVKLSPAWAMIFKSFASRFDLGRT